MLNKKQEKHVTDADAIRSLPRTRKEVFFDLLKNRKMTLFALSCFTFMFFIPLAVDLFYFNFLETIAIANGKDEYLFSLVFYSMLIMLPCMLVGFVGFAGAFYTIKKLVWQEDINLAQDFLKGIKENVGHAIVNGIVFGIVLFGLVVGGSYLLILAKGAPDARVWCGIGIGALILLFLVLGIVNALTFTQDVYYSNPYGVTFKNAFCFFGLLNWRVIVLYVLTTGVVVALACLNMVTLGIGLFLFAILNSLVIVIYTLMSHSVFDKYINKEHYPDMVNKGLYKDDKEA